MTVIPIGTAWAGHPVQFALVSHRDWQFVAYYNEDRVLTVWQRRAGQTLGKRTLLAQQVGWDSHNGLVLAVDALGYLHLSGNMHDAPLVYFRSRRPLDSSSLERVERMSLNWPEDRITYPQFLTGHQQQLYFIYRQGSSGRGTHHIYRYHPQDQRWETLLPRGLLDGRGRHSAYPHTPWRGPDGRFHLVWIWRNSPDAATNHSPSYARSRDLQHWETSTGAPLPSPLTREVAEIVDPVPPGGGAINNLVKVGLDQYHRPIVSYIKYDPQGHTQVYCSRKETTGWKVYQISRWNWRWSFGGGGSIPFELDLGAVTPASNNRLHLDYARTSGPSGRWQLDTDTLQPRKQLAYPSPLPHPWNRLLEDIPGLRVCWARDAHPRSSYLLRWEAMQENRDHPRSNPIAGRPLYLIEN